MKFSITIPTYKARYLDEAIRSVVDQTYTDWELVIVDDCSPEDLRSIAEPYLRDSRVSYYRNDKNCGAVDLVDNWNICLGYCTGDYVICIGDDDRLLPNCLEDYRSVIESYPGLNVYHTRTEIIDEKGEVCSLQEQRPEWESALSMLWNRWDHRDRQYIGDFCYDTRYLKQAGGYYKLPLAWGSDDITALLAARDKGIANVQEMGFQYRENRHSISSSMTNKKLKIEACLAQYLWADDFIRQLEDTELSALDRKYLKTIQNPRDEHFLCTFTRDCKEYISGSPQRALWCYRQLQHLHYGKGTFLKWFIKSFRP